MRVGFDARLLRYPGVGRYIRAALEGISYIPSLELIVYVSDGDSAETLRRSESWTMQVIGARSPGLSEQWIMARQIARDGLDIFHAPHYVTPLASTCPLVVTLHDLVYLHFPDAANRVSRLYYGLMVRQAARRARVIVTDSQFISEEVRVSLNVPRNKLKVVPIGAAAGFVPVGHHAVECFKQARGLSNYVLYIGTWKPWKNVRRLLQAFQIVVQAGYSGDLVLAGMAAQHQLDMIEHIQKLGSHAHVLGTIDEADMPALYTGADALIMPSTYEGFGLPVLEAMACGTPVVVSQTGPLPEVTGDVGVYFDPLDVNSISGAMLAVVLAPERRQELSEGVRARARLFSVDRMGQSLYEVYQLARRESAR